MRCGHRAAFAAAGDTVVCAPPRRQAEAGEAIAKSSDGKAVASGSAAAAAEPQRSHSAAFERMTHGPMPAGVRAVSPPAGCTIAAAALGPWGSSNMVERSHVLPDSPADRIPHSRDSPDRIPHSRDSPRSGTVDIGTRCHSRSAERAQAVPPASPLCAVDAVRIGHASGVLARTPEPRSGLGKSAGQIFHATSGVGWASGTMRARVLSQPQPPVRQAFSALELRSCAGNQPVVATGSAECLRERSVALLRPFA